jgi:dephospho-CoA kinase
MLESSEIIKKCYGLTGAIATGKSVVAKMLADLGARIIDTDCIAREVVKPGCPALREIAELFGGESLNPDGTLARENVRDRIIRDPLLRERLNRITHPRIMEVVAGRIEEYARLGGDMPIIIDVPLLYESGWDRLFPRVILVYAPLSLQVERLMARDRLDRRTAELTIAVQMSIEEKKGKAAYSIDNSGTLEETRTQVERLFPVLCGQSLKTL